MYISTRIVFALALLAAAHAHDTAPERSCTTKAEAPAHPPVVSIPPHIEATSTVSSCGPVVAHKNEMCDTPVLPVVAPKAPEKVVERTAVEKPAPKAVVVEKPAAPPERAKSVRKGRMPCMVPVVTVSLVPVGECGACSAGMCTCGGALAKLGIERQAEAHVDIKQGAAAPEDKAETHGEGRLVAVRKVKKHTSKGGLAVKETRGASASGSMSAGTVHGERKEVSREVRNGREVEVTRLYKDGKVTVIVRENGKEVSRTVEDSPGEGKAAGAAEKDTAKNVVEKGAEAAKDAAEKTTDAAKNVAEKGAEAAGSVAGAVGNAAHAVVDGVKGAAKSVGGLFSTDASKKVRSGSTDGDSDN